jgi:hypothetical protein
VYLLLDIPKCEDGFSDKFCYKLEQVYSCWIFNLIQPHSFEIIIRIDIKFDENILDCEPNSMFVPSSTCEPSSTFVPFFFPILFSSSSDDDGEDENAPMPTHLPQDDSIEHEPTPTPPLPKWVHSTREVTSDFSMILHISTRNVHGSSKNLLFWFKFQSLMIQKHLQKIHTIHIETKQ